jgi:aminoglycoside phosphotransferase
LIVEVCQALDDIGHVRLGCQSLVDRFLGLAFVFGRSRQNSPESLGRTLVSGDDVPDVRTRAPKRGQNRGEALVPTKLLVDLLVALGRLVIHLKPPVNFTKTATSQHHGTHVPLREGRDAQARSVPSVNVESQIHAAVARLVAPDARIEQVRRFRGPPLPFPAKLVLSTDVGSVTCVAKASTELGRIHHEIRILQALEELEFAAPRVMAGPVVVETSTGPIEVFIMSNLPGEALPWIGVTDVATAGRTCRLLFDAIDSLHALTPRVTAHQVASYIPRHSLDDELVAVRERVSPWTETRIFKAGIEILRKAIPRHRLPLVFSNGDYNPLNVLADDSGLTGWVDFEHACFEDPYIGLPKFRFWSEDSGWSLADQVGLVERFLYRRHVSPTAFMVRVALRGLTHLHNSSPDDPPVVMLREIERAIQALAHDDSGTDQAR